MERGLHNITSATTTTLLSKGEDAGFLSSIRITNAHETRAIFIGLYLDDGTNQTYFFKKYYLNAGETKFLNEGVNFDNSSLSLKLITSVVASNTGINVNVIIN